ncbi:NDR1/HIN1-like protein 13 [Olea europaea var. sylvestris]|uniref:NDR1 HIN1 13 n=1 Tax=Olea europaea subsp. europaea TaxID=158383 RepID=A0A8S0TJT1_OLEEU|nr:NDR1/HIN1-like protein 13 [Olea europaea var. sylvestris]CAA3006094.1 NDR1 HIN1 13 [Olea europaea subsp. europaea]
MSVHRQRETNPHFYPQQLPTGPHESEIDVFPSHHNQGLTPPPPRRKSRLPPPPSLPPPQFDEDTNSHPSIQPKPPKRQSRRQTPHYRESTPPPPLDPSLHQKEPPLHPQPVPPHLHANEHDHVNSARLPESRKTNPLIWLIGSICAILWIIIIVGGLIILIVYLVFRPRNPKFDISTVSLNAAYLDMGYFLNADLTVLANFTNPNSKVNIDFSYVVFDLFYNEKLIATRYIQPFSVMKSEYRFADVHLMSSQVRLPVADSLNMQRQIENGRVDYEIRGLFRAKSKLGGFLRYSYWLSAHCKIALGAPPTGILIRKQCQTKRQGIS